MVLQSCSGQLTGVSINHEPAAQNMNRTTSRKDNSRKIEINRVAAKLFREKGYKSTGMRDIAVEVGVEAASLYNHIRSKSELLQQICFRMANDSRVHLDEIEGDKCHTAPDKLEAILRYHINIWVNKLDEVLVTTYESRYLEEPWLSDFMLERRQYMKRLEAIIRQGIDAGEICSTEPYTIVLTMMSMVRGIEFWHRKNNDISSFKLAHEMVTMLLKGLLPRPT